MGRSPREATYPRTLTALPEPPDSKVQRGVTLASSPTRLCRVIAAVSVLVWATTVGVVGALGLPTAEAASAVAAISTGLNHSCALTSAGGAKCWGNNTVGEVGDGTTNQRDTPVGVVGLGSGVSAVEAGLAHTCGLSTDGSVRCWGSNDGGQLGDGTTKNRWTPVDVDGLSSGVEAIAVGSNHSCALTTSGGVKCWGHNESGQLGDGSTTNRHLPVDVIGLGSGVAAISAGAQHTCALTTSGAVECWGANFTGQLGDNTTTDSSTPVDVIGLSSGVAAISAGGGHTCAVTTAGGAKCWGANAAGQLGDGTTLARHAPVNVLGLSSGVTWIAAGGSHTCAVQDAAAKCWGLNHSGQLGDGITTAQHTPVAVLGLESGVTAVSAGSWASTCATAASDVLCWGNNATGQLGDGTTARRLIPTLVVWAPTTISVSVTGPVTSGSAFTVTAIPRNSRGRSIKFTGTATWSDLSGTLFPGAPLAFDNGSSTTSATVSVPFHRDQVTLTSSGVSGQSRYFNVLGPLASVAVKLPTRQSPTQPSLELETVDADSQFTVKAEAFDSVGNLLSTYDGSGTWSSLDGGISPSSPSNFVEGVSLTTATIPGAFKNDQITLTTGGVVGSSHFFTVVGPLAAIAVKVSTPVTAGMPFTVKAVAMDSLGTPITDYNASATWSSLDGGLSPADPNDFVNGVSATGATVPSSFSDDQIMVASGGVSGRSPTFNVH